MRRCFPSVPFFLCVLFLFPAAVESQPDWESSRLIGVHDVDGAAQRFLRDAVDSCDRGWITHAHAIGHSGATGGGFDAGGIRADGVRVIVRLDDAWERTVPTSASERDGYRAAFVDYVTRSSGVGLWIVGNEPNVTLGGTPDRYVAPYVEAYVAVRDAIHAIPGHGDDRVLVSAPSPWSPCFLDGWYEIIDGIRGRTEIDGFSFHAYTGHTRTTQDPSRVTLDDRRTVCPSGRYPTSFGEFRVYRDYIEVMEDLGFAGAPAYVTESGHACEHDGSCYSNEDNGYFAALYREADEWNRSATTKLRAITPYRWLPFGDGTARDFAIGDKPNLQRDLANTATYTWTETRCGDEPPPPGRCRRDHECDADAICDLRSGTCAERPSCGSCPAGEICRRDSRVCVPVTRGADAIAFAPGSPEPGGGVTIDASSPNAYTNIGVVWEGPLPSASGPALGSVDISNDGERYHWRYDTATPTPGTYRATFFADPAATVYAIAYLNVGDDPTPDAGTDAGTDAGETDAGDAGGRDAGDTEPADANVDTSGSATDTGMRDGGIDGGCDCRVAPSSRGTSWPLLMLFGIAAARRVRSRGV